MPGSSLKHAGTHVRVAWAWTSRHRCLARRSAAVHVIARQKLTPTWAWRGRGHHASSASQLDRRGPCDRPAEAGAHVDVGIAPAVRRKVERRGSYDCRQKLAPTWAWASAGVRRRSSAHCVRSSGRSWRPRGRGVGVDITPAVRRKIERCGPCDCRQKLAPTWAWASASGASQGRALWSM